MRAYLISSPASHAEDLRFSEKGVQEIVRNVLLPLWNAYSFFVTYALADGWKPQDFKPASLGELDNDLDKWVVSRLQSLIRSIDEKMDIYHLIERMFFQTGVLPPTEVDEKNLPKQLDSIHEGPCFSRGRRNA